MRRRTLSNRKLKFTDKELFVDFTKGNATAQNGANPKIIGTPAFVSDPTGQKAIVIGANKISDSLVYDETGWLSDIFKNGKFEVEASIMVNGADWSFIAQCTSDTKNWGFGIRTVHSQYTRHVFYGLNSNPASFSYYLEWGVWYVVKIECFNNYMDVSVDGNYIWGGNAASWNSAAQGLVSEILGNSKWTDNYNYTRYMEYVRVKDLRT